jgi:hypothetical protein
MNCEGIPGGGVEQQLLKIGLDNIGADPLGDFANIENKHTQMYYYIRVSFSCVSPIS